MKIIDPQSIPLSLYIHFPWCIKKCPYCDFNSHTLKDALPDESYVSILIEDLLHSLVLIQNRPIQSIFLGGGTPSLFSAQALSPLFDKIAQHCKLASDIEITLEANPSTVEQTRFKDYRDCGINRISLGIQSFQDVYLHRLGRVHNGHEAQSAINAVQKAGFEKFNLDLMFGLPEQSKEDALKDIQTALSFSPPHLSWYELTLEPNTPFAHQPPKLPPDDDIIEMQLAGQSLLSEAALEQYEVSAYTRQQPCRHNMNYWEFGDYIALGAGAHGKVTLSTNKILRYQHVKHPKEYMKRSQKNDNEKIIAFNKIENVSHHDDVLKNVFVQESHYISDDELPFEYFLNTLRLKKGASLEYFTQRTGLPLLIIQNTLDNLVQKKWITPITNRIQTTSLGMRFLNDVTAAFLNE